MSNKQNLRTALGEFIDQHLEDEQFYSKVGVVEAVDIDSKTCEISFTDGYPNVDALLQQNDAVDDGFLILPLVGSTVVIAFKNEEEAYVSMFSSVETVQVQGGTNGGMVLINELTAELNALVDEVNALKDQYNTHIHITTATVGLAPVGVISPTTSQALPVNEFNKDDYENENFTQ